MILTEIISAKMQANISKMSLYRLLVNCRILTISKLILSKIYVLTTLMVRVSNLRL